MKYIIGVLITILAVAISIVAYITVQKIAYNQAIDGCMQAGRLTFKNAQGYEANTPDNYWYQLCMKEKGYKISH